MDDIGQIKGAPVFFRGVDDAFFEASVAAVHRRDTGPGLTLGKLKENLEGRQDARDVRTAKGTEKPSVPKEKVDALGRREPGVLPVGDRRSAQEIIADTPALANLR